MKKNVLIVSVTIAVVLIGLYAFRPAPQKVIERIIGVAAGPEHTQQQVFLDGVQFNQVRFGPSQVLTKVSSTVPFTASELCNNPIVRVIPSPSSLPNNRVDVQFASSSNLRASACLSRTGDYKVFFLENATSSPSTSTVRLIAGDASNTLMYSSSTDVGTPNWAKITIVNTSSTSATYGIYVEAFSGPN